MGDIYAIITALCWSSAVILFDVSSKKMDSFQLNVLKNFVGVFGFILTIIILSIPIPNFKTSIKKSIDFIFKKLPPSAIILSGGNDIGEYKNRDILEYYMIDLAIANNIPLIGICRGMQIINSYFGGSSVKLDNHVNVNHNIFDSLDNKVMVNSYHNYTLNRCPISYNVIAYDDTNKIEAIKHKFLPWEGWMWHPEREQEFSELDIRRFNKLFL